MNATVAAPALKLSSAGYNMAAVALALISTVGCMLNAVALNWAVRVKQKTIINTILINIVLVDLLLAVGGIPFSLTAAILHRWPWGHIMCLLNGFQLTLLGLVSVGSLTCLSYERYRQVKRSYPTVGYDSRRAHGYVVFSWVYAFALAAPPLFGWAEYVSQPGDLSCSISWEKNGANARSYYIYFLFLFGILAPFIATFTFHLLILSVCSRRASAQSVQDQQRSHQRLSEVGKMIVVIQTTFIAAWTPYVAFALFAHFAPEGAISPAMAVIPSLLAKSSICYNPVGYFFYQKEIRQRALRLFCCRRLRRQQEQFELT